MHELLILVEQIPFLFQVYTVKHMQIGFIRKVKISLNMYHLNSKVYPRVRFITIILKLTILSFTTEN